MSSRYTTAEVIQRYEARIVALEAQVADLRRMYDLSRSALAAAKERERGLRFEIKQAAADLENERHPAQGGHPIAARLRAALAAGQQEGEERSRA